MIEKININSFVKNNLKDSTVSQKTETSSFQQTTQNPMVLKAPLSGEFLHNYYVSFSGKKKNNEKASFNKLNKDFSAKSSEKMSEIESNLSYFGEKLLNDSRQLAQKHNHSEITQVHVLRAGLENIKTFIDNLDSGKVSYDDESSFATHSILEDDLGRNVIKEKEKRDKIRPIIENEIKVLDTTLEKMPKAVNGSKNKKIEFAKDFLNDIYSLYSLDNDEDMGCGDGLVHDSTIFSAALYPNNDQMKKDVVVPFRNALKDEIQIDKKPLSERIYLSFYDDKAANIWKNLAVGTNMVILHDKDITPGYLVNSFLQVFENSESGFGNLNKNNTEIINFNDNGELDNYYINQKIQQLSKNKNKNYVMVMSIMDKDLESLAINGENVSYFKKAPKNIKFVMVADKDRYYKESTDSVYNGFFTDCGEILMPLMNMNQAKKMFREQPKLLEKIKKPFSKQAIDKSVEVANQLKGNYPEKAQKVMDLVAAYYVDKERITLNEVQNYVKEAKEIFKPVENDGSIKVVFDTGLRLRDMVGSPTTKKEAQSIVERIKDKSIGTKGFVIYSQDGSVGAGRKYTAQSIAGEANAPYVEINAVDFGTKEVDLFGGGNLSPEASMKKLFGMVKAQAETNPYRSAVLFIENFDYFSFGEYVSEYHEKAMSQLIREMNKAQEQGLNIIVMGSMNDPRNIGEAATKSFKFIDQIEVESPGSNKEARSEIIDYYIKKKGIKLAGDEATKNAIKDHINILTEHSSYIEILTLLDKAQNVGRERKHKLLEKSDFTEALLQLECGRSSSAKELEFRKDIIASHECGHALNNVVMRNALSKTGKPWFQGYDMSFITLDARSNFGGAVFYNSLNNTEMSFERVFSQLVSGFGGNSCEHKFFAQDGSWGITGDMESATFYATMAAGIMGQGKHFGKKSLDGMMFISEEDKNNLNKDIEVMLKNAQIVSDAITEIYADFNREFTSKYAPKVNTGECIIQKEEFVQMFEDWKSRQTPEKQEEMRALDDVILQVIEATKRGVACKKV